MKTLTLATTLTLALFSKAYADPITLTSDLPVCTSKKALTILEGALLNEYSPIVRELEKNGFCMMIPKDSVVEEFVLQKYQAVLYNDNFYYTSEEMLDKVTGVAL